MRRIFRTRDYLPDPDRDIHEEMESHLELKAEELTARGMPDGAARAEARRTFGDRDQARTEAASYARARLRRQGIRDRTENLQRDIRYALRRMARSPAFTLIATVSLAIGIGANTAVFSVVNGLFLRPPPFHEPRELVQVWTGMPGQPPTGNTSWREFQRLLEVDGLFSGLGGFESYLTRLREEGGSRPAFVETVTANLFSLLGVEPVRGRFFLPGESGDPGGNALAVLGHSYWMRAFGGDSDALGETVYLGGFPFTIIGIAPPELSALQSHTLITEFYVPISMAGIVSGRTDASGAPTGNPPSVSILARLAPGVSRETAEARVGEIAREVRAEMGAPVPEGWAFRLWPIEHKAIDPTIDAGLAKVAAFLLAVAGLVLLLTCTNLASLLLARGVDRKREIAVRRALGAPRRRLVTQLVTETLLLSALGGLGGFFMAQWILDLLFRFQPNIGVIFTLNTSPDARVLLFTMGAVGLAGLLFGLVPALAATRPEISTTLKGTAGREGKGLSRLGSGLVVAQMSVSVILLTGAGLFFHSFLVAQDTDPGFNAEGAVSVWVDLQKSGLPRSEWRQVTEELRGRAGSRPNIRTMGATDQLPLLSRNTLAFSIPGLPPPEGRAGYQANVYRVDAGYLTVMGIPLLSGRGIEDGDREDSQDVAVVSQSAARRFWPGEPPLGKEIIATGSGRSHLVVGVVDDVKVQFLNESPEPTVYFSLAQRPADDVYLVARGPGDMRELARALRQAVHHVNPDLLIMQTQTLEERVGVNLYPSRAGALFLGAFGLVALVLAAIGLYGVVSLSVSRRTQEVGIRMSMGADAGRVVAMVLRGSLGSAALGGCLGLGLAFVLARLIRSFLFGVEPADPATMVAVPLLLGGVALTAAFIPARRASKVDPVQALRAE